jgi:hypothetical protein
MRRHPITDTSNLPSQKHETRQMYATMAFVAAVAVLIYVLSFSR